MAGDAVRGGPPPAWYALAWILALPLVVLYLCWRALRQREYLAHWAERFLGHAAPVPVAGTPVLWVHAVSVGETRAAGPLVEELARRHPQAHFVLTHMTPTGRAAGAALVRSLPGRVTQRYLPYDLPWAVRRFLREAAPHAGVVMETEMWPALLHAARGHGVPVLLANARLSPRSLAKALRYGDWLRRAAANVSMVAAQTEADRERIAALYAGPLAVTGNLKFDQQPDPVQLEQGRRLRAALQARLGARPVLLFASTREGEERLLCAALEAQGARHKPRLLLVVPRHPQRFEEVARLFAERSIPVLRRAQFETAVPAGSDVPAGDIVLLGDSMGEMALYYAMADIALVGGSVLPLGGQNLIEACACGCPVLLGPHMFNFAQAADDAVAAGAALRVADMDQALRVMEEIAADDVRRGGMAQAALAFAGAHGGATLRTADLVDALLTSRA